MDRGIFLFLMIIPALAPLASGSLEPWVSLAVASLSFFVLIWLHFEARRKRCQYFRVPGISLWMFLCGFVFFQLIPLPPWLLKLLSPHTYDLYDQSIWVVSPGQWMSLSVKTKATMGEFFHLSAMGALYVSAVQVLAHRDCQKKAIFFLCLLSGIYALLSFLPLPSLAAISVATPFSITELYAVLGLLLPLGLAFLMANKARVQYQSFTEQLAELSKHPETRRLLLVGLGLILLVSAVLLRAPLFVSGISFLAVMFLGLALSLRRPSRKRGVSVVLGALVVLLAFGTLKGGSVKEILGSGQIAGLDSRWDAAATIALFQKFPLVGSGFGTFSYVAAGRFVEHPEIAARPEPGSDVVTWLVEGGMVGVVLSGAFALVVLRSVWRGWRSRRSSASIYLSMGAMAGLLSGIFLSVFGLCLSRWGGSMIWALLAAIAVATSHSRSRGQGQATDLTKIQAPRVFCSAAIFILFLWGGLFFHLGSIGAQLYLSPTTGAMVSQDRGSRELQEDLDPLLKAVKLDPLEEKYPYGLGKIFSSAEHMPDALAQYSEALRLAPLSGAVSQDLGLLLTSLGDDHKAQRLLFAAARNDQIAILPLPTGFSPASTARRGSSR